MKFIFFCLHSNLSETGGVRMSSHLWRYRGMIRENIRTQRSFQGRSSCLDTGCEVLRLPQPSAPSASATAAERILEWRHILLICLASKHQEDWGSNQHKDGKWLCDVLSGTVQWPSPGFVIIVQISPLSFCPSVFMPFYLWVFNKHLTSPKPSEHGQPAKMMTKGCS